MDAADARRKGCTLCHQPRDVLVRCQIDRTGTWHFVCPGKCWTSVSGGSIDAAGHESEFPHYRYGGMWKNKHAYVSAKKPRKSKVVGKVDCSENRPREWKEGVNFTRNDRVGIAGQIWICRRSHCSEVGTEPRTERGYRYWKEVDEEQQPVVCDTDVARYNQDTSALDESTVN